MPVDLHADGVLGRGGGVAKRRVAGLDSREPDNVIADLVDGARTKHNLDAVWAATHGTQDTLNGAELVKVDKVGLLGENPEPCHADVVRLYVGLAPECVEDPLGDIRVCHLRQTLSLCGALLKKAFSPRSSIAAPLVQMCRREYRASSQT